jgi:predicted ATPase
MKRPLDEISIYGYKSIRKLEQFKLTDLNILIGANGAGKSNFISIFKLLNQIVDEQLQNFVGQQGGADKLFFCGKQVTSEIALKLKFDRNGYECILSGAVGDSLFFSEEAISYHKYEQYPTPYKISIGSGNKESRLKDISRSSRYMTIADHVIQAVRSWKVYHFHDTSPASKIKQRVDLNDNEILRADASNLAAFLFMLRETQKLYYDKIVSTIQNVAPFFNDFVLRPNPLNENTIILEWREKGSDMYLDANALSDGTLRFICLATLLLQPKLPSTILIDEPELGLHPYAIKMLASLIRQASSHTQLIVSTQSTPLVNQFTPKDIIIVDRVENESIFKRIDESQLDQWIEDYGLGDIWEKNLIGGRP